MPGKRVLMVDDDRDIRRGLSRKLTAAGYAVRTAANREEALEEVSARHFHVALVDIMLVEDDNADRGGLEVIRAIKNLEEGTRCIAISAHRTADAPVDAINVGVDGYIRKVKYNTGEEDPIEKVNYWAERSELKAFGHFDNIFSYLSHPNDRAIWETRIIQALRTTGGEFHKGVVEATEPFLPVLPVRASSSVSIAANPNENISMSLWSRAIGEPIKLVLSSNAAERPQSALFFKAYRNMAVTVVSSPSEKRSAFLVRTLDVGHEKSPHPGR